MADHFSVYCDESCHLEKDGSPVMVIGAVWCPTDRVPSIHLRLKEIRDRHSGGAIELKWSKVSPSKLQLYLDVLDYFFDDDDLSFRAVVANKAGLRHEEFDQSHDDWYYKMHFLALRTIVSPDAKFRIFLDYKDTHMGQKAAKLRQVICNANYDFSRSILETIQPARSVEVGLLQLCDLLTGAVCYSNRGLDGSQAKLGVIDRFRKRSGLSLVRSSLPSAKKVNVFRWEPQGRPTA